MQSTKNANCYMNVYSESHALLAENLTAVGVDVADCDCVVVGWGAAVDSGDEEHHFDDLVVDWTNARFPLLGWVSVKSMIPIFISQGILGK